MSLWGWIATFALVVLNRLLMPRLAEPGPDAVSTDQLPTIEEGGAVPVVFGMCRLRAPGIMWQSDEDFGTDVEVVQGFPYSIGKAYRVSLGLLLCMGGTDEVLPGRVWWDDKLLAPADAWTNQDREEYPGTSHIRALHFRNSHFWSKDEDYKDGILGDMYMYLGQAEQGTDVYLEQKLGAEWAPTWNRFVWLMFRRMDSGSDYAHGGFIRIGGRGCSFGASPYIKPLSFEILRYPRMEGYEDPYDPPYPGGTALQRIEIVPDSAIWDANPVYALWEALTNDVWGAGLPTTELIDADSFHAAAQVVYDERLGGSWLLDKRQTALEFCGHLLKFMDAALQLDPVTGMLKLKLIRDDYDVGDLPVLDASCVESVERVLGSWAETKNVLHVTYTDRAADYNEKVITLHNDANLAAREYDYDAADVKLVGATTPEVANKVGWRMLKTLSTPLAKYKLTVNRKAWALRQGDPFVLQWAPFGPGQAVLRVTTVDIGSLEKGTLVLDAVDDVYAWSDSPWGVNPPTPEEQVAPTNVTDAAIIPAPWVKSKEEFFPQRLWALVSKGAGFQDGFEIYSKLGSGQYTQQYVRYSWQRSATGDGPIDVNSSAYTSFYFTADAHQDFASLAEGCSAKRQMLGQQLVLITQTGMTDEQIHEIISYENLTWDDVAEKWYLSGVVRACLDTVPRYFNGTGDIRFFFFGLDQKIDLQGQPGIDFETSLTVKAKFLVRNKIGQLDPGDATEFQVDLATYAGEGTFRDEITEPLHRSLAPWPPTHVRLTEGTHYPEVCVVPFDGMTFTGDLVIKFRPRSRFGPYDFLGTAGLAQGCATTYWEQGTKVRIYIYDNDGASPAYIVSWEIDWNDAEAVAGGEVTKTLTKAAELAQLGHYCADHLIVIDCAMHDDSYKSYFTHVYHNTRTDT